MKCKDHLLDLAETVDALRVVPRLIVFIYLGLLFWLTVYFAVKYFGLPAIERTTQVTAFTSVVMTAAYGAFGLIYKFYSDGGRDWTGTNMVASSTSTKVSTETVTK